jgi:O-methyltransferase
MKGLAMQLSSLGVERLRTLDEAFRGTTHLNGEIWECGVWRGGTSLYMACLFGKDRTYRLFDTFAGMPCKSVYDSVNIGEMKDCDYNEVVKLFKDYTNCHIYKGIIPFTFDGLQDCKISVAHIDVDNYDSVKACIEFIYPRMEKDGYIIIDDYNDQGCRGAKIAIDNFFSDKPEKVIGGNGPQVYFIKL